MLQKVAITGVGAVVPGAEGVEAVWARVCAPAEPEAGPWPMPGWRGFFFAPLQGCAAVAERAARQAWRPDGGPEPWILLGTCSGDMRETDEVWAVAEAGEPVDPAQVMWPQLAHQPAEALRARLGLGAPAWAVSTACTSGAVAIGAAARLVSSGAAPRALAVGVDVIGKLTWFGFGSLGLQADGRCRPFDRGRTGLNLGEGAAAMLLEPVEAAHARGAEILGYVAGYGNATDAFHMSAPEPTGAGARRAIAGAIAGGPAPGWINAHGTGTPLNDAIEARALAAALPGLPVTATKGALGHTLGAAGALEAVITLHGLRLGTIPPSLPVHDLEFDLDLVQRPRACAARAAISVNLAFGGSNTAILLEAP